MGTNVAVIEIKDDPITVATILLTDPKIYLKNDSHGTLGQMQWFQRNKLTYLNL